MIEQPHTRMTQAARDAVQVLKAMFKDPLALAVMFIVSAAFLLFALWFPMRHLLYFMFTSDTFSAEAKTRILTSSLEGFQTNFLPLSRWLLIISALLSGLTMASLVAYLRKRTKLERAAGTSVLGMIGGIIGVGCASCGSIILSSIFGVGAIAVTAALPFKGVEFSILGTLLLVYSFFSIAKKYSNPLVCKPKK